MKSLKSNQNHYTWGEKCNGWHLIKSDHLSVIEERMPPHSQEVKHYHHFAEQFFYVLKGIATFEMKNQIVEVSEREGIQIHPQTVHQIKNAHDSDLEFLVVSSPTTSGDRIEAPFTSDPEINYNGKKFKSVSNTDNGEVSSETIFHYHQKDHIIWATYGGGEILFGTLSGRLENGKLIFTYQHQNLDGHFKTGKCESVPQIINGKLFLQETWEWTCDDFSKGESMLEEIK